MTHRREIASNWTKALFDAYRDSDERKSVSEELKAVLHSLKMHHEVYEVFTSQAVHLDEKQRVFNRLYGAKMDEKLLRFFHKLLALKRLPLLPLIEALFSKEVDKEQGVIAVKVTSSCPLDEKMKATLREKLENKLSKKVLFDEIVDPALLGGFIVCFKDNSWLDYSLKTKLDKLKYKLTSPTHWNGHAFTA